MIHYRNFGRLLAEEPPAVNQGRRGRIVWSHAVPWATPTPIYENGEIAFYEWFQRGALRLPPQGAPFSLGHVKEGGDVIGRLLQVVNGPAWADVAAEVFGGEMGDAFLDLLDEREARLPVSIAFKAFPGARVRYANQPAHGDVGYMITKAWLYELATVPEGAYSGAHTFAVGHAASLASMGRDD